MSYITFTPFPVSKESACQAFAATNSTTIDLTANQLVTAFTLSSPSSAASASFTSPSTRAESGLGTPPTSIPSFSISNKGDEAAVASPTSPIQLCRTPEQILTPAPQNVVLREVGSHLDQPPTVTDDSAALDAALQHQIDTHNTDQYDKLSTDDKWAVGVLLDLHEHDAKPALLLDLRHSKHQLDEDETKKESDNEEKEPKVIDSVDSGTYCHGSNLRLKGIEGNALWALSKVPRNNVDLPLDTVSHEGETECNRCTIVDEGLKRHYIHGYTECKKCRTKAKAKANCEDCKKTPKFDWRSARERTTPFTDTAYDEMNGKKTWGAASYEETQYKHQIRPQELEPWWVHSRTGPQRHEPWWPFELANTRRWLIEHGHLREPTPTPEPVAAYTPPSPQSTIDDEEQPTEEEAAEAIPTSRKKKCSNKPCKKPYSPPAPYGPKQAELTASLFEDDKAKGEAHLKAYCDRHKLTREDFEKDYKQRLNKAGAPYLEKMKKAAEREGEEVADLILMDAWSRKRQVAALYDLPIYTDDAPAMSRKGKRKAKAKALDLEITTVDAPASRKRKATALDIDIYMIDGFTSPAQKRRKVPDASTISTISAGEMNASPSRGFRVNVKLSPKADPQHPDHEECMAMKAGRDGAVREEGARPKRTPKAPKKLEGCEVGL